MPSIAKLAGQYGIPRGTALRVQLKLRDWGLVEITPGWGVFVAERPEETMPDADRGAGG